MFFLIEENLSVLKIHKLAKKQYDKALKEGRIDENALYVFPNEEIVTLGQLYTDIITHRDTKDILLSDLINSYILNIDYEKNLAFNTSEIVIGSGSTTSRLGYAILGQMILGQ